MPSFVVNDIRLNVEMVGRGRPVLFLHGFMGSSDNWWQQLEFFATRYRVLAVDLIGHGASAAPSDPAYYTMDRCVSDLTALLDLLNIDTLSVVGYSMGGRVALNLAAAAPHRVTALVLESASPGLAQPEDRFARLEQDLYLAGFLQRQGLEAFVDYWEQLPLFATQKQLPPEIARRQRSQRLAQRPHGLINSLRGMGTGAQRSLWRDLPGLHIPTLIVTGQLDTKYAAIGQQMARLLPEARLVTIPGAGHNVHLERPGAFNQAVDNFLKQVNFSPKRSDSQRCQPTS